MSGCVADGFSEVAFVTGDGVCLASVHAASAVICSQVEGESDDFAGGCDGFGDCWFHVLSPVVVGSVFFFVFREGEGS